MLGLTFAALAGLASPQPTTLIDARLVGGAAASSALATDGHGHEHKGLGFGLEGGAYRVLGDWVAVGLQLGYRHLGDTHEDAVPQHGLSAVPTLRLGARGGDTWHLFGEVGLGYTLLLPTDPAEADRYHFAEGRLGGGATFPLTDALELQTLVGVALDLGTSDSAAEARSPEYTDDAFSLGARAEFGLGLLWRL